jgi:hypothetical protein
LETIGSLGGEVGGKVAVVDVFLGPLLQVLLETGEIVPLRHILHGVSVESYNKIKPFKAYL